MQIETFAVDDCILINGRTAILTFRAVSSLTFTYSFGVDAAEFRWCSIWFNSSEQQVNYKWCFIETLILLRGHIS
jgi:hypothetical protein